MTLPNSQKLKDFDFKLLREEKDTEMWYDITRDELAHIAKKNKKCHEI